MHGTASQEQCTTCQCGKGLFQECVFADTGDEKEIMGWSCSNCYYEDGYLDSQCSPRKPSQSKCECCFPAEMSTKNNSAYRLKKAESILKFLFRVQKWTGIIHYAFTFQHIIWSLRGEHPRYSVYSSSQSTIPTIMCRQTIKTTCSTSCSKHCGAWEGCIDDNWAQTFKNREKSRCWKSLELFAQEQKKLAKLHAWSMEKIKKSISLQEALVTFKAQENKLGASFLWDHPDSCNPPSRTIWISRRIRRNTVAGRTARLLIHSIHALERWLRTHLRWVRLWCLIC